jgi:CheY-like chemotaxis protein
VTFGRREPSQARVIDLNRIIREFEPFLRRTVSESVELRLEPAQEPMMIDADPAQIEQVLTNLALNARDAMPEGGRLTIATSAAMVDEDEARFHPGLSAGRHVRLMVRDTGEGMDDDVAARAFDPFFTTKPKGAGAGLGLASVYGIVSQAGGTIRVDSAPGAGATFTIHLPASEDAASPEPVRSVRLETTPGSGGRILVVEDDPSMRMLLAVTLRESGYEVVQAGDGAEALAAAQGSGPIDAVLTDVVMPQMSGPELITHLRRTRPDLPAVCMSGYAEPVVNPGNIADGVRFIGKPFTMVQLLAAVREALHPATARS